MSDAAPGKPVETVSRRRYLRERRAKEEAESLLEAKSRELWEVNEALRVQAARLEEAVRERTEDLQSAKVAAEAANQAKSAFLAMISHDIRTPLNGILGLASSLCETLDVPELRDQAQLIHASGQSLLGLLNDILDLTKIEARQMDVEAIPVDLLALLEEVRGLYVLRAEGKGLALTVDLDPAARAVVLTDPTRLRQVLGNLLSNGVKFTDSGHVRLGVHYDGAVLTIQVEDTGMGVPEDRQDRLFETFAQTDASITRKFGGSGLGLAISRQICRLMGGDLVYRPGPQGGSCFELTVRAARAPDTEARRAPPADAGLDSDRVLKARRWRVLAAEDNMTNQKVLALMLKRYGLSLTMVPDGQQAVAAHCGAPYDLILMDVNMPEMDGLEAAAMIRQFEKAHDLPRVPIIALSANAMTHQVAAYLREGIDAHVAKPIKRDLLARCMARYLMDGVPAENQPQ